MNEQNFYNNSEEVLDLFTSIQIEQLREDDGVFENPYSLLHPGYILYLWGRIFKDTTKFNLSIEFIQQAYERCINIKEYSDAGEFLILKLKSERFLPKSNFSKTYKTALKIFKSLLDLNENDPYYLHSILDLKLFAEKHFDKKFDIKRKEEFYRTLANQYSIEASSKVLDELRGIKITDLFEAIILLDEIKESLSDIDEANKKALINSIIYEIDLQKKFLKKQNIEITYYNRMISVINLDYTLAQIYIFLNLKEQAKIFFFKALRRLEKLLKNPSLAVLITENKRILYQPIGKEIYTIYNIEIYSEKLFFELLYTIEIVNILTIKKKVIGDVRKIDVEEEDVKFQEDIVNEKLMETQQKLVNYIMEELKTNSKILEEMRNKYLAFCVYPLYQILKIKKKLEISFHQEIEE